MADTPNSQPGTKSIKIDYSEGMYFELKKYANENGITEEQAFVQLANDALRLNKLSRGIVTELSPEVQDVVKKLTYQSLEEYTKNFNEAARQAVEEQQREQTAQPVSEKTIVFAATNEIIELIVEINKGRALKGLAPIEKSIAELLYHWGENMGDFSSFERVTGLGYDWYKETVKKLALIEREANGAASNVIETSGLFGRHSIVDTPIVIV